MTIKSKILVIEDDTVIREGLKLLLEQEFDVVVAEDGARGIKAAVRHCPDLILLDLMMPELHGFQVCKSLREDAEFNDTPIIVLTALNDTLDRTKAFELGVDDFIAKPFHNAELLTRIRRRLVQNKSVPTSATGKVEFGNLSLDHGSQSVHIDRGVVHLSSLEFSLLEFFLRNPSRLLKREEIIEAVWTGAPKSSRLVDPHIVSIRKKLKGFDGRIVSVYRAGYMLRS